MCIASLKHLQKMTFNTKGHFLTLNYDPSSGINFQQGQFFMRGGVVKNGGSLFSTLKIDPQSVKNWPGESFFNGVTIQCYTGKNPPLVLSRKHRHHSARKYKSKKSDRNKQRHWINKWCLLNNNIPPAATKSKIALTLTYLPAEQ